MKSKKTLSMKFVMINTMIFLFLTGTITDVMADPRPQRAQRVQRATGFKHIPIGSQRVNHRDSHYVIHQGRFYRPSRNGYERSRPPSGIVTNWLPAAALAIMVAGITYYVYEDIYYRKIPSGYQVVENLPVIETKVVPAQTLILPSPGTRLMVMVDMLNVRRGPGLDHPVKFQVYYGNMVMAKGNAPDWIYIQLPDGSDGWVMDEYLSVPASGSKG